MLGFAALGAAGLIIAQDYQAFARYQVGAYDYGGYSQVVWLLAHFRYPFSDTVGIFFLGDHWTPILVVLSPFYRLFPFIGFLAVVQAIAVSAATIPIYRLTSRRAGRWLGLAVALDYLCHPSTIEMARDFSPVCLAIAPLLAAIDAVDEGNHRGFVLWCSLALMCKEEVAIAVIALSLYAWLAGRWRRAWMMAIAAGLWFGVALVGMSLLAPHHFSPHWSLYGTLRTAVHQGPSAVWSVIWQHLSKDQTVRYAIILLGPVLIPSLAASELLIAAAPSLLIYLLADRTNLQMPGQEYNALPLAILFAAACIGSGRLTRAAERWSESRAAAALAVGLILASGTAAGWVLRPTASDSREGATPPFQARERDRLLARIPPYAIVSSPNLIAGRLAWRPHNYMFPNPFQPLCWGGTQQAQAQEQGGDFTPEAPTLFRKSMARSSVEYVALFRCDYGPWPLSGEKYESLVDSALTCPAYGIIAAGEDTVLLKKGAPFETGLSKIGIRVEPHANLNHLYNLVHVWFCSKGPHLQR